MAEDKKTGLITRVPHASGMLDGTYDKETVFDPSDHRAHRKQEWLDATLKKVEQLQFLTENMDSTIGQIAIKFALSGPMVASVLPNLTNLPQLEEFTATSETEDIPEEFIERLWELHDSNFEVDETPQESPVAT